MWLLLLELAFDFLKLLRLDVSFDFTGFAGGTGVTRALFEEERFFAGCFLDNTGSGFLVTTIGRTVELIIVLIVVVAIAVVGCAVVVVVVETTIDGLAEVVPIRPLPPHPNCCSFVFLGSFQSGPTGQFAGFGIGKLPCSLSGSGMNSTVVVVVGGVVGWNSWNGLWLKKLLNG